MLFPGIGEKGQRILLESKAVIIGCGALGTVQAEALCRAGVGTLRIVDRDFVEESNLQRQTLFTEEDAQNSLPKAIAAQRRLRQTNSQVKIDAQVIDVNHKNIERLIDGMDCILDATDNFETRFLINDVAVKNKVPWVYGAAVGGYGLSMTIIPHETPCLGCVFESMPAAGLSPTCDTAGVLAPIVNLIASVQVAEALKILTRNWERINRKMTCVDVWENSWRQVEIASAKNQGTCSVCKLGKYEFLEGKSGPTASTLCGRDSVQISQSNGKQINLEDLAGRLKPSGEVRVNPFLLRFKVGQYEIAVFPDGRGIVRGTKDTQIARSVYAKYIGL